MSDKSTILKLKELARSGTPGDSLRLRSYDGTWSVFIDGRGGGALASADTLEAVVHEAWQIRVLDVWPADDEYVPYEELKGL